MVAVKLCRATLEHCMSFIADLHIHSRYSRAVSRDMVPESLYRWAQLKGITVVGTGDFTHPAWFTELQEKLEPAEPGLYRLKPELAAPVDAEIPAVLPGQGPVHADDRDQQYL